MADILLYEFAIFIGGSSSSISNSRWLSVQLRGTKTPITIYVRSISSMKRDFCWLLMPPQGIVRDMG
jgi:hypothetical protein